MKVCVIGAGPAGLMAAISSSKKGHDVILLERNEKAGKKIYITGKGRCNVTNACSNQEFIDNIVSNPRFMYSSINHFSCNDAMNFFENNKVELVVERGNRVFPKSYKASDITKALLSSAKNVDIHYNERVLSLAKENEVFVVKTNIETYYVDRVILATGGKSYSSTGSSGDGYELASKLGHSIIPLVGGLNGILVKERIPRELVLFTLKNVELHVNTKKKKYREFGEIMFLSNGLAGPISLTLSSLINREKIGDVSISLDLKPALDKQTLDKRILKDIIKKSNENVKSLLRGLVPFQMVSLILNRLSIDNEKMCNSITSKEREEIVEVLKNLTFTFNGLDNIERAIVTSGGVSVKEIDSKTLQSKIVPGLYFAGEIMDVDAFTGGFNMQIALCSGKLAGDSIE